MAIGKTVVKWVTPLDILDILAKQSEYLN